MKTIFAILLVCLNTYGQNIIELESQVETEFDFGIQVQEDWKEREQLLKDIASEKKSWDTLTAQEARLFEKYDESYGSMWDIEGGGCSWYCGAGEYAVTTSSFLKSQNTNSYSASNINDFSYQTAWVEGVKGYGIGEFIEFSFVPKHPRLTKIKIANGYIKSKKAWRDNSRVKKLKMYVNDVAFGIINLKDVYALQSVTLEKPIGYSERGDLDKLTELANWKIRFEILEVYKGDKYEDTVISEIFFDGIDVH